MKYSSLENKYMVELICSAIKQEAIPEIYTGLDLEKLMEISKKQQVYSMVASCIDVQSLPENLQKEINHTINSELMQALSMQSEFSAIEELLAEKKIKYMPLKGAVIRQYYPKQKMRQMGDYDILYDYSKRDELVKLMKQRGFRLSTSCENSDDFFKEPFYMVEWHRQLFFEENSFCPEFDLWKNAIPDSEKPYRYTVEPNEHFIYTVCHMYKHYATKGCGIRFLCDIYLMLKKENIDLEYCKKRLDEIGIGAFFSDVYTLIMALFENGQENENSEKILNFLLSNGIFGNNIIDYEKKFNDFDGSKLKYLFRRIFPTKKSMHANFRILEKKPYLLPIYYIVRLFTKLKYNSSSAKNELKALRNIKK